MVTKRAAMARGRVFFIVSSATFSGLLPVAVAVGAA
jgi:hypothetical protein